MADHQHTPKKHSSDNPVLIEAIRGDTVESFHRGSFAVVDAHGSVVMTAGDTDALVFPRSGIKPIQALGLVETGAARAFGLGHATLALACGSHYGEITHTDIVGNWLERIGCKPDDLVCGPSLPWTNEAKASLTKEKQKPN